MILKKEKLIFKILTLVILTTGLFFLLSRQSFAATFQPGELIKSSDHPAVYYYDSEGKRHLFPDEVTYYTWYSDFSAVEIINEDELTSTPLGSNITVRPCTKLVKLSKDPRVYFVSPGGVLHWIPTEKMARDLYGPDWAMRVFEVPEIFWSNYVLGSSLTSSQPVDGCLVKYAASPDVYLILDGQKRKIKDAAAFLANHYKWYDIFRIGDQIIYDVGQDIVSAETNLTDATQTNIRGGGGSAPTPTPTPSPAEKEKYPWHHNIYTTQFYVGTPGSGGASAWDVDWVEHYGGVDDPINRNGYYPRNFVPKENPFYFALPYSDFDSTGARRENVTQIPWYHTPGASESLVKNRWIEVKYKGKSGYAQWQDCGPVTSLHPECDDFDYVFGSAEQPTKYPLRNVRPGLDISPALSDYLGMDNPADPVFGHKDDYASWRFVDAKKVPSGPWKEIITTSQVDWTPKFAVGTYLICEQWQGFCDYKHGVERIKEFGGSVVLVSVGSSDALYNSEYLPRPDWLSEETAKTHLPEIIDYAHSQGLKIYAWLPMPHGYWLERNPDWISVDSEGAQITHWKIIPPSRVLSTPEYLTMMKGLIKELVDLGFDGIDINDNFQFLDIASFDDFTIHKFEQEMGVVVVGDTISARAQFIWDNLSEEWYRWRADQTTELLRLLQQYIYDAGSDIPLRPHLMTSGEWAYYGWGYDWQAIGQVVDMPYLMFGFGTEAEMKDEIGWLKEGGAKKIATSLYLDTVEIGDQEKLGQAMKWIKEAGGNEVFLFTWAKAEEKNLWETIKKAVEIVSQ